MNSTQILLISIPLSFVWWAIFWAVLLRGFNAKNVNQGIDKQEDDEYDDEDWDHYP